MPDRLPSPSSSEQDPTSEGKRGDEDNPFAPPPEGAPDQPWQPRRPEGERPEGEQEGGGRGRWSSNQPGRSFGGFGQRPGQNGGSDGQGGPGQGGGMRWDPTDPAQRRARFALLAGMWAFFFALFNWPYVALLLGALALNWGISALRAKKKDGEAAGATVAEVSEGAPTPAASGTQPSGRPQTTAAVSGLVTAGLALAIVAATFTAQLVYRDYYTCVNDALTQSSKQTCEEHLPKQLRPLLGEPED
ncbi:hypothetical protein DSC45_01495 [Streptomyces sp. YIM 130001]|uniref:hypothetical protein n=1 Tax=Streptomyces sp. YIM 130001 TaxID=2259644 RepID=UPI000ED6E032|nr:hypothetical protein [Streptomyces sp. YIM 130001]RII21065.1 hypothetical protein DSC45_01495 [Streptomyces sp. YIM 130001]